jgi:hypothetical protein
VWSEFEAYLKCGLLEYGLLRVRCEDCHHEQLVAISWPLLRIHGPKAFVHPAHHHAEGFSHGRPARALVRGEWHKAPPCWLLMCCPIRQWVLSFPFQLRFLFARYPHIMGKLLGTVYRTLAIHITKKAGYNKKTARKGAVTLIQRFSLALTKSPVAILNSRRLIPERRRAAAGFVNRLSWRFIICATSMVYLVKITMAKRVLMMNILVHHPTGNRWLSSLFIWNKQQQLC